MAKQSSVQITCKVDGDGVDARFEPPAQVNAAAPDGWGPQPVVIPAGGSQGAAVPVGATGILLLPSAAIADVLLGGTTPLDPSKAHFIAFAAGTAAINFGSTAGGTLTVMWT